MYELQGKILEIKDTQEFKSGFTKREFIVDNGAKFQNTVKFELVKDDCSMIDKFSVGDDVKVSFYINGSEWKGNHFVNLSVNKIEATSQSVVGQTIKASDVTADTGGVRVQKPAPVPIPDDDDSGLPF